MKILLVEDDDALISLLTQSLTAHHFVVDVVQDGERGWTYGSTFDYDLLVLDVMLPKLDGISLCQRFRAEGHTTPILLLTAQDTSTTKVQGLEAGADDYVVKPFDLAELIARIRALLRRRSGNPSPWLIWENLHLNSSTCEVTYKGQPLNLTTKEFELLELLLRDCHHVFSTDEILDRLWSSEEFPSEATVRSHLRRLRQKLSAAGSPPDLIATLHGRGYYLKAPAACKLDQTLVPPTRSLDYRDRVDGAGSPLAAEPASAHSLSSQQQYLAFLNETWKTTQPNSVTQTEQLAQAVADLQTDQLTPLQQAQAHQIAHKLAGTLGTFGLCRAMQVARQLEHGFSSASPLRSHQAALLNTLVTALQQEIQNTASIQLSQLPNQPSPLLLMVNPDASVAASLVNAAERSGLRTAIAPTIAAATAWLTPETIPDPSGQVPIAMLLRLPSQSSPTSTREQALARPAEFFSLLEQFAQQYPTLPILVIGDSGELNDRLQVIRRGGRLFLDPSVSPEQVVASIVNLVGGTKAPLRLMIVDDDQVWLQTLPTLLKPWGFEVTTLADPQQFWQVLQAVTPDVLVLDIKMPQINGFELCQILRSDPRWQRLPVLFLSALTDPKSQSDAFTVGADDYLCKPVLGKDLANRILNRLRRVRAWVS